MSRGEDIREAFSLYDKKGTGTIDQADLGDLLRALGQNPTQKEVGELCRSAPPTIDFNTFKKILERPNGYAPAGTVDEFIRGLSVFDKDGSGRIGAGEMRYVLTSLGERLTNEEVDELLRGVRQEPDGSINYREFVTTILAT